MSAERHEELRALIAPYVLDAVAPDEAESVRAHLLSCEECMAEADGYAAVASSLTLAVAAERLPEGFGDRVLARVAEPRPARRPRATRRSLRPLAYAALVVCIAALGAGLVDARRDAARTEQIVRAVLRGEGMGLRGPAGAVGKMVPTRDGGTLVVAGLKPAPQGRTYQLWLMRGRCDGDPCEVVGAGTFDVSDGLAVLETDHSLDGVDGVAVTIEPEGGSPRPTASPVMTSA